MIALLVAVLMARGSEAYAQSYWPPAVRLTNTPGGELFPDLSPDGSRVAFAYRDRQTRAKLYIMDVTGGNRTEAYYPNPGEGIGDISFPDWSPDGSKIVFGVDCDILLLDLLSGDARTMVHPDSGTCALRPRWSPDGRRLAYRHNQLNQPGRIVVLDADTGITHPIEDNIQLGLDLSWSPDGSRIVYTDYSSKGSTDVFYVRTDDGSVGQLTDDAYFEADPVWLPGGMGFLFLSARSSADLSFSLWLMDEDGSNIREAGFGTVWGTSGLSVSSDGRAVVLTVDGDIYYAASAPNGTAVGQSGWGRVKSTRAAPK